jgi:hypothetical protein
MMMLMMPELLLLMVQPTEVCLKPNLACPRLFQRVLAD